MVPLKHVICLSGPLLYPKGTQYGVLYLQIETMSQSGKKIRASLNVSVKTPLFRGEAKEFGVCFQQLHGGE